VVQPRDYLAYILRQAAIGCPVWRIAAALILPTRSASKSSNTTSLPRAQARRRRPAVLQPCHYLAYFRQAAVGCLVWTIEAAPLISPSRSAARVRTNTRTTVHRCRCRAAPQARRRPAVLQSRNYLSYLRQVAVGCLVWTIATALIRPTRSASNMSNTTSLPWLPRAQARRRPAVLQSCNYLAHLRQVAVGCQVWTIKAAPFLPSRTSAARVGSTTAPRSRCRAHKRGVALLRSSRVTTFHTCGRWLLDALSGRLQLR
jgi:hypothetical protein